MRGALTALLFGAQASHAQQIESSVDLGAVALRYADTLSTGAAALTPHFFADWTSGFVDATGTYSRFTAKGWSIQGALSGSRFISTRRGFVGEVGGFAGGSSHSDGTRTGEALANGRMHVPLRNGELFVGIGGGRTWDGAAWRTVLLGEAGAALGVGPGTALLTLSPAIVNDSIKYADAQASILRHSERLDLTALLGVRFGDQLTTLSANARSWASVTAVAWMRPRLALVASGGSYPIDPTQGFPGGRYISLSVRIATGRYGVRAPAARPLDSLPPQRDVPSTLSFTSQQGRPGFVTLRVFAPDRQLVEISGDFTNWVPVRLDPDPASPGSWSATLPIKPGKYQMNVRVDGGPWVVPTGLLAMVDEFGGTVGLLIVE
ncbi:MAG: glycogen-binding domain-containing protein [Gemmatimonadaceae bacterium]